MTRFRSSLAALPLLLIVTACAASSGAPATAIAQPGIAAAYLPLHARTHLGLDSADGAAVVIAPGIAVTNAHNANLLDSRKVIGTVESSAKAPGFSLRRISAAWNPSTSSVSPPGAPDSRQCSSCTPGEGWRYGLSEWTPRPSAVFARLFGFGTEMTSNSRP